MLRVSLGFTSERPKDRLARRVLSLPVNTMNARSEAPIQATPSWLSLIAEAAGVEASQIARIELCGHARGDQRIVVQILAHDGRVLGAERWEGSAVDLQRGVRVDVGAWMTPDDARDARAIAFADPTDGRIDPSLLRDPNESRGQRISRDRRARVELEDRAHGQAA